MTVRACAAGGRALPCTRRGSAPAPPRLRGGRQGSAPAPRACAASGRALPCTRRGSAPAPRAYAASGRALPCTWRGSAPAPRWGYAPNPEMLTHLFIACGRDGSSVLGVSLSAPCPSPPLWQRAEPAYAGAGVISHLQHYRPEIHWQNDASGFRASANAFFIVRSQSQTVLAFSKLFLLHTKRRTLSRPPSF